VKAWLSFMAGMFMLVRGVEQQEHESLDEKTGIPKHIIK